jgi:hypothetical protein
MLPFLVSRLKMSLVEVKSSTRRARSPITLSQSRLPKMSPTGATLWLNGGASLDPVHYSPNTPTPISLGATNW